MTTINKLHLVERAAERLLRSGSAPDLTGGVAPPGAEPMPPSGKPPRPLIRIRKRALRNTIRTHFNAAKRARADRLRFTI